MIIISVCCNDDVLLCIKWKILIWEKETVPGREQMIANNIDSFVKTGIRNRIRPVILISLFLLNV